jgi:threonylcarbamoyladenosine tRNA methylthiotransferase MtaB
VRSRPLDNLKAELTTLAANGYREVVLVGINLTAYGQDTGHSICDAVEVACGIDGIERVRLGSIEPDHLTDDVIERLARQKKLCPQFHLSLQSRCDATLKRTNRHYTADEYAAVCDSLRRAFPGCALTTDVMVGFAGETEEEFGQSLAFVERIAFAQLHVFAYSRRPGTPAAKAGGQLSAAVKAQRSRRMIAVGEQTMRAYRKALLGTTVQVLAERCRDGMTEGHTDTYIPVLIRGCYPAGQMVSVTLTELVDTACIGEAIE